MTRSAGVHTQLPSSDESAAGSPDGAVYDGASDTYVTFSPTVIGYRDETLQIVVGIAPGQDREFQFWNSATMPDSYGDDYTFNVIPLYHPCRQTGRSSQHLINGDTDMLVTSGGYSFKIQPPAETQVPGQFSFSHWAYLKHPIVARGQSFTVEVDRSALSHSQSRDRLASFISAALGANGEYVSVSGGFRPPAAYAYPQATGPSRVTGAENSMAWQYHTLEAEGEITGAYVPRWFTQQRWLDYYKHARQAERVAIKS